MSEDVEVWKNGDLSDIGRDMKNSTTRLETGKSGPKTQKVQKDIIDKLDKKIKDLEDEENKKNEQAAAEKNKQEPSRESIPLDDQGKGIVDEKKLRKIAEDWGKLPPQERAKAIQEVTKDLPPKFKPMIEDYFKSLNKIKPEGSKP
jgi:BMFP domain-containing protein YqiC